MFHKLRNQERRLQYCTAGQFIAAKSNVIAIIGTISSSCIAIPCAVFEKNVAWNGSSFTAFICDVGAFV